MASRKRDLFCCRYCGRDTSAQSAICIRCVGGTRYATGDEERGRKGRPSTLPLSAVEPAEDESLIRRDYHGGSVRDDI